MSSLLPAAPSGGPARGLRRPIEVIIVSSVMFTFISYWRTAAVVLCDLASTAYYIGGIVEGAIGPAAPWFILGVMIFSYAVRSIYIESCTLFVRGGVYRVVKEALGGFLAKLAVSALMFDFILTGPISERRARTVDELRAAGVGVSRVLFVHPGTADGSDLFKAAITMLDPEVSLGVVCVSGKQADASVDWFGQDLDRALRLKRDVDVETIPDEDRSRALVLLAQEHSYDAIILSQASQYSAGHAATDVDYVVRHAPCWVCLVSPNAIPHDVDRAPSDGVPRVV